MYYDFNKSMPLIDIVAEDNSLFVPLFTGEEVDTAAIDLDSIQDRSHP